MNIDRQITAFFQRKLLEQPMAAVLIPYAIRLLSLAVVGYYGLEAASLFIKRDGRLLRFLLVPAILFLLVTMLRKFIGRKRPFEVLCYVPLVPHENGLSFPSRHTASAAVIGMAAFYVNGGTAGGMLLLIAAALGALRVAAGVHYFSDVAFGYLFAVAIGWIGFF